MARHAPSPKRSGTATSSTADRGEPDILFIDLHLVHEVTSPQAFDGLRLAGRTVHRPDLTVATADHNVPTIDIDKPVADPISARQLEVLAANCAEFGITCYPMGDANQGIVHIIGPEQGLTQPGMTIVCGDSHTSTHGAFGALAFGIGTSEVEHVLATQTLPQARPATMAVDRRRRAARGGHRQGPGPGHHRRGSAPAAASGHVIEYRGSAIRALSMEGRMTVCNMSIEAGARAGMIAPDDTTFAYLEGRDHAPKGGVGDGARRLAHACATDEGATFDKEVALDAADLAPPRHLGHQPGPGGPRSTARPRPGQLRRRRRPGGGRPGPRVHGAAGRHADARRSPSTPSSSARAPTAASRTCGPPPRCWPGDTCARACGPWSCPGSHRVKAQAESEGLDKVFTAAGFDWREPGCSMCLAMNPDKLAPGERARRPPTATSRGARAGAGAPTWSRRRWPRPPRWPATSPPRRTSTDEGRYVTW